MMCDITNVLKTYVTSYALMLLRKMIKTPCGITSWAQITLSTFYNE